MNAETREGLKLPCLITSHLTAYDLKKKEKKKKYSAAFPRVS